MVLLNMQFSMVYGNEAANSSIVPLTHALFVPLWCEFLRQCIIQRQNVPQNLKSVLLETLPTNSDITNAVKHVHTITFKLHCPAAVRLPWQWRQDITTAWIGAVGKFPPSRVIFHWILVLSFISYWSTHQQLLYTITWESTPPSSLGPPLHIHNKRFTVCAISAHTLRKPALKCNQNADIFKINTTGNDQH